MNTRKQLASLIGGAAMMTVLGMTAGLTPAHSAPPQNGATLFVIQDPANQGNYLLAIVGRFPMSQADAVGFVNNINNGRCNGGIGYNIYGDDEGDRDPWIHGTWHPGARVDDQGYLNATSEGLAYRRQIPLRKNFLNEDRDGTDEIYATVVFQDSDCQSRGGVTQVITRDF